MKQDEYSTANQLWNAGVTEVQHLNPSRPNQRQTINPSQLIWKLDAGAIIKYESRPTGVQLKRSAKLLTLIGLITKHEACHITFILYPLLL